MLLCKKGANPLIFMELVENEQVKEWDESGNKGEMCSKNEHINFY